MSSSTLELLPDDHGLLIHLQSSTGKVSLQSELDAHYTQIHPNCYAPRSLSDVYGLPGGGSGTAVFHGRHPTLGSLVMKHGGATDMQEVFSLSVISQELQERGLRDDIVRAAAERMKGRIPEFVMVYLSPFHLRDRGKELWSTAIRSVRDVIRTVASEDDVDDDDDSDSEREQCSGDLSDPLLELAERKKNIRQIRLIEGADAVAMEVYFKYVTLEIPDCTQQDRTIENGHAFLAALLDELVPEQHEHYWKFTVAQKTIGGPTAENGATVLTSGKLKDDLLDRLIEDFTCVIQDLRKVTVPEETKGLEAVRKELNELQQSKDVMAISKTSNAFVGSAIRKNFALKTGRFAVMRALGERFRLDTLILAKSEETPARFLGALLKPEADLDSIFVECPAIRSALDDMEGKWLDLLKHATSFEQGSATDRIWTCGLTDAGLHNLFLCRHRGVELFDLGEPQLSPQPAFLTKFFMSFFHAFGMEENGQGTWVQRFKVVGDKLGLTRETQEMIPYCYDAFSVTMDHFVEELFEGDESVRELLVKYVVLQLLSDAAFCLGRWEQKGGGKQRFGARASEHLDKWLWRSLWDLYIACHVHQRLLIDDGTYSLHQRFTQSFTLR